METNVGKIDATARWLLAAAFFLFSLGINDRPAISLAFAALAVVMIGTALTRKCPFYTALRIHTGPREPGRAPTERPRQSTPIREGDRVGVGR